MSGSKYRQRSGFPRHRLIGLLVGPLAAVAIFMGPAPDGLSQQGWWTGAVGVWMAVWWMTEALPLAVTALLPLIRLCQTNANQVEFVIPDFRWTAQNTCDFQQPLCD